MRLFVALELSSPVRAALERAVDVAHRRAPKARWADPQKLHLTLAFLGETEEEKVPALKEALTRAASRHRRLSLVARGGGGFGASRHPRVLWIGVEGELPALTALQADLIRELVPLGFTPEKRPFRPHLTLARAKNPRGDPQLAACVAALEHFDGGEWPVRKLVLFQSQLSPKGARYTQLFAAPLAR
ncbi:MAG: RNA 2',3'-cyclic phosphodiesterase [Myxococcota bacterium]